MSTGDIRDEWRLNRIEQKADNADRRLYELDSLRSDVGRLQCENREIRAHLDGVRAELEACLEKLARIEGALEQ